MKVLAVVFAAAAVAVAQEIAADGGSTSSSGDTKLSHSDKNNGEETTNSLVNSGNKGNNKFDNLQGNSFSSSAKNTGVSDSSFTNPSQSSTSGNTGNTANGDDNALRRRKGKRDTTFHISAPLY